MNGLSTFQAGCLAAAARKANDLAALALEGYRTGRFDPEPATVLVLQALSCLSAGFDEDVDHALIARAIDRCGIATPMRGTPANDDWQPLGAA